MDESLPSPHWDPKHRRGWAAVLIACCLLLAAAVAGDVVRHGARQRTQTQTRLVAEPVIGTTHEQLLRLEAKLVGQAAMGDPISGRLPDVSAFRGRGIEALELQGDKRLTVTFLPDASRAQRDRASALLLASSIVASVHDEYRKREGAVFEPGLPMVGAADAIDAAVRVRGVVPGVIAMVTSSGHLWSAATGVGDLEDAAPMSPALQFRIGSTTKTMTAVVVLQLVAQDSVALDAPVSRYLPGVLPYRQAITIRQLLAHTSGLVDEAHFGKLNIVPDRDVPRVRDPGLRQEALAALRASRRGESVILSPAAQIAVATTHPLAFQPGSRFNYSNTDYLVLTELIERVTGRPLSAVLRDRIFRPAGMKSTFLATEPSFTQPYARSYAKQADGSFTDATDDLAVGASGSGAVVSTAADLTLFFQALMENRLLRAPLVDEMLTPTASSAMSQVMTAYGFGLTRYATPCGRTVWGHGGVIGGYLTSVYATRDGQTVVVFMENADETESLRDAITGDLFCSATSAP